MRNKKAPKANLENYSKLFAQLGLVLALTIVYVLIQNKTFDMNRIESYYVFSQPFDNTPPIIEYTLEAPKRITVKPKAAIHKLEIIPTGKHELESVIVPIDPDKEFDMSGLIDVSLPDDPVIDNILMDLVEEAPVFPGCKGSKKELKACFTKKIHDFILRKFNDVLASTLQLKPGNYRISTIFKINTHGYIVDLEVKAPHKALEKETIRVIHLLPQFIPGKQQHKPVNVQFALPITFRVE